jgi:hypothetical protein
MNVKQLIDLMTEACGKHDPSEVEVWKVVATNDMWGEDWEKPRVDAVTAENPDRGYKHIVLVK